MSERDPASLMRPHITGTHDGELMGLPPTGRTIDVHAMGILRFADGRVVERWGIADSLTQMQ